MFSKKQWFYLRHWIILLISAELIMMLFNRYLWISYLVIAGLFLVGFLLRVFNLYPGVKEPLVLDFSAVLISALMSYVSFLIKDSNIRFILIIVSSIIILPHLIYIICREDI